MNNTEEIKVLWEGPFSIEEITEDKIDTKYDVTARSKGLYQVYGSHPLYGDGVLVYIGRTKDSFQSRLNSRWVIENGSDAENVQIYLGTIFSDSKKIEAKNIDKMIEKSEVLLINAMKPAYNSSNIQSVQDKLLKQKFIIHNEGNYRNLYPVLDSKYFWETYKNFAVINAIAKSFNVKIKDDYDDEYYGFFLSEINKFDIPLDYTLWFGVSYNEWNESKIPLELQVYSENKNIMKKIKLLKLDTLKYKEYQGEGENYFQFEFDEDFLNLDDNELKKAFNDKITKIIKQIKL